MVSGNKALFTNTDTRSIMRPGMNGKSDNPRCPAAATAATKTASLMHKDDGSTEWMFFGTAFGARCDF